MSKVNPGLSNITYGTAAYPAPTFGSLFERRAGAEKPKLSRQSISFSLFMKTTFKSVVAGLALAFVSTPLLAATSPEITNHSEVVLQNAALHPAVYSVEGYILLPCTATAEISVFGISMSFSVTADSCLEAARELARQSKEMLQAVAN